MSRKIHLCGCHLGFKKLQIPCQTTNYLKLQNNCIYAQPISRFQLSDILVFIADIARYAMKTGIEDITNVLTPVTDYLMQSLLAELVRTLIKASNRANPPYASFRQCYPTISDL